MRGQLNLPRNVAVYLARKLSGKPLTEIVQEFSLWSYSSVSSIVCRTENLLSGDKDLMKQVQQMKDELVKSRAK